MKGEEKTFSSVREIVGYYNISHIPTLEEDFETLVTKLLKNFKKSLSSL